MKLIVIKKLQARFGTYRTAQYCRVHDITLEVALLVLAAATYRATYNAADEATRAATREATYNAADEATIAATYMATYDATNALPRTNKLI